MACQSRIAFILNKDDSSSSGMWSLVSFLFARVLLIVFSDSCGISKNKISQPQSVFKLIVVGAKKSTVTQNKQNINKQVSPRAHVLKLIKLHIIQVVRCHAHAGIDIHVHSSEDRRFDSEYTHLHWLTVTRSLMAILVAVCDGYKSSRLLNDLSSQNHRIYVQAQLGVRSYAAEKYL